MSLRPRDPVKDDLWTIGSTTVKVLSSAGGYVVYQQHNAATTPLHAVTLENFKRQAIPGEYVRKLPYKIVTADSHRYFPVWEDVNGEAFFNTGQSFDDPDTIREQKPWRMLGIIRIPLDFTKMVWLDR